MPFIVRRLSIVNMITTHNVTPDTLKAKAKKKKKQGKIEETGKKQEKRKR